MKYRSRTDIAAVILESARTGATKTRIMYKAYLSYALVNQYLNFVQENGLIKYEKMTKQYRITEKGIKFLHSYDQMVDLLSSKNKESTIVI
jgi:predicted transcriptional regulator